MVDGDAEHAREESCDRGCIGSYCYFSGEYTLVLVGWPFCIAYLLV